MQGIRLKSLNDFADLYAHAPTDGNLPKIVTGKFDYKDSVRLSSMNELLDLLMYLMQSACYVDFANKRIGGGYLESGLVQEELIVLEFFDLV